jgi:hypothetical protein
MSTSHVTTAHNPRRKSPAPPVSAGKKAVGSGLVAAAGAQAAQRQPVDPETKWMMIAEAAYYRAEKRGFVPGGELQDWLEAEAQMETASGY